MPEPKLAEEQFVAAVVELLEVQLPRAQKAYVALQCAVADVSGLPLEDVLAWDGYTLEAYVDLGLQECNAGA